MLALFPACCGKCRRCRRVNGRAGQMVCESKAVQSGHERARQGPTARGTVLPASAWEEQLLFSTYLGYRSGRSWSHGPIIPLGTGVSLLNPGPLFWSDAFSRTWICSRSKPGRCNDRIGVRAWAVPHVASIAHLYVEQFIEISRFPSDLHQNRKAEAPEKFMFPEELCTSVQSTPTLFSGLFL